MKLRFPTNFAPFGLRHEIAKRYTPLDWLRSIKVERLINSGSSDDIIFNFIENNKAGLIGRLGGTEARFIGEYLKLKRFNRVGIPMQVSSQFSFRWKKRLKAIHDLSGFYAESWSDIELFVEEYLLALKETDVLGAWGVAFTWIESLQLDPGRTKVIPVGHTAPWIEPWNEFDKFGNTNRPWVEALRGKKVLVISSFAESIERQHLKAGSLFVGKNYPHFELLTMRAPQTSGQKDLGGATWFELLDQMKLDMNDLDFDIALIAAGAYSYPLANHAKSIGKIGIHTGGGLQLFFGIMGNRWNHSPEVLRYVNESWTRPSLDETPTNAEQVEGACYW